MAITFRDEKNAPLTHEELDANFRSFFFTASFSENNLSLQRKDGVTINVPVGGQAFADFQANGGSIGDVFIADSQVTGSRMIIDLFQGQFYDKTKAMNSDGGNLSSDEWYIDFDPAASSPYYVHFGPNFAISSSGYLYASGAVIEGDITASAGLIGGFSITPDSIHGPENLGVPTFFISGAASTTDHFISASNFSLKGSGDITGSAVLFSGGTIAGWEITNTQIKKSTNIILDASNESISINDSTFGNEGIQLEYNSGTPRFYVGDATGSFVKFDGTDISLSTRLLEISASNIEISSTEASMSLGGGAVKLLGATSAIEVGTANKFKISGSATDAMLVAGTKTGFGTDDAGVILGMDGNVPTLDLTKDASNYVRFDTTSGVDIKTDTFKLDTTYFDIDTSTQRLNIFDTASAEIIRLGEISDDASDLYGLKIFNGSGTGSADTIAMFGQQGNKIGGWELTGTQIRSIPASGFGGTYASDETGLIINSSGRIESSNFVTNVKGWRIDTLGNGSAEFENMRIRGTLKTTVFEKESVNVVGGQLMVTNASTVEPLRSADGVIIAGSSSYAANAVTLSLANVSGFEEGEILKVKTVDETGFSVEYMYVSGSKRYSEDVTLSYNTGSIDPDGLAGELYVERGFGGVVAVSSSLTTLSTDVSDTTSTTIEVGDASGIVLQNILKIDNERVKVVGISNTTLTVIRGYHDTTPDSHTLGDNIYLIDTDKEFLAGLVSTPKPINEGQVVLSTGVYNPATDISSGYIMMNANPRDISTPYMDIIERTGSGVYDLQLRSRLGDLSGLSSGYLYGNNEPGFGLYTENGFFKGAITADTGSIAGILHVATVAGGLETGQKISIGRDVSGTNDGIYVNNNNYWYTDGAWKVGGADNFISLDNFTDGNLVINTETFTLDTSTFMISSSLNNGTLTAGANASSITNTAGNGIYMDGTGKFRVGTPTTGNNYIYWDGTTLNIKGAIDITGGTGATSADLDAITGSFSSSIAGEISASDAALSASIESTTDTLDGKIFTDSTGRAVRPPTASSEGLYLTSTNLGFYKSGEWKTYMDNEGDFFLTGSAGNKLAWDSATGTLEIAGQINITGGNAATQDYVTGSIDTISGSLASDISSSNAELSSSISSSSATLQDGIDATNLVVDGKAAIFRQNDAPTTSGRTVGDMWIDSNDSNKVYIWNGSAWAETPDGTYDQTVLINSTSASLSSSVALDIFTDSTGKLVSTPDTSSAGASGLFLGDTNLGFYSGSEWRTYMANNGNFFLTGSDGNFLTWDGGQLTIQGAINITSGNAATTSSVADAQTAAENFAATASANAVTSGSNAAAAAESNALAATNAATASLSSSLSASIATTDATALQVSASQALVNQGLNGVLDGKNAIFRTASEPTSSSARADGDIWIDTDDGNKLYVWGAGDAWTASADSTYDQSQLITNTSSSIAADTFTDSTGKIISTPNPSAAGLYLGDSNLGFYSNGEWKTFMANNGNFFLTGSDSNYLKWDGSDLTISGDINILGGNAATTSSVAAAQQAAEDFATTASNAVSSSLTGSINTAVTASTNASLDAAAATQTALTASARSVDADGKIVFNPTPSGQGLFLNANNLGYYNNGTWSAYLSASGEFYLTGSGNSGLSWDGSDLSVDGTVVARAGEIGGIDIASNKIYSGTGTHGNSNTGFYLDSGSNFSLGDKLVWDGTSLTIEGSINVTNSNDFASQAELDAATGSLEDDIQDLVDVTSSLANPTSYAFGGSGFSLANVPNPSAGLHLGADKLGYHNGTSWLTYMDSSGHFLLSGSGDDSLSWNGSTLRIGNKGVGPSLAYQFSGTLDSNVFDSSITTVTAVTSPVLGAKLHNNADAWDEGLHSTALFDRQDGGIFEWDIVVGPNNVRAMFGLYEENPSSFTYTQLSHAIYLANNRDIYVYEEGTSQTTLASSGTAWTTDTDYSENQQFRLRIQPLPTGARYEIFKNGDFTTPAYTYDSATNGVNERYLRPGIAIFESNTSDGFIVQAMAGGASLGQATKISGNTIQTGILESSNLSTAQGSQFNLNDGTFKLGGTTSPDLHWNGSTLSVRGNITVTNPDSFATPAQKNKDEFKIIVLATGSVGSTNIDSMQYLSSQGYTGGNSATYFYDNNNSSDGNTNPANITGFDTEDYDLYVFDNRNWALDGSEIQLALNLFDLGKSVLVTGNDSTTGNYTGSYNTEWPIKATVARSGGSWMVGPSASGKGMPASHPILAGISGNVVTTTSSDGGQLITQLKAFPQGGTIVQPFSITNETTAVANTNDVFTTSGTGQGITSFIASNPRGGRLVNINAFSLATSGTYGSFSAQAAKNLTSFLLRTDPAIEAHYMQVTSITGEMVTTGKINSANLNEGSGTYTTAGTLFDLDNGSIKSKSFAIDSSGNANFKGDITGASGTFSGTLSATVGSIGGWTLGNNTLSSTATVDTSGYTTGGITLNANGNGSIHTKNFYIDTSGNAFFKGSLSGADITGANGTFTGTVEIGGTDLTVANTLNTEDPMSAGSVVFNPNFLQVAADGRPAGAKAVYGNTNPAVISYSGSADDGVLQLGYSDSSLGVGFNAFPINPGAKYKFTIRVKQSSIYSAGMYIRFAEKDSELADGMTHLIDAGGGEFGVDGAADRNVRSSTGNATTGVGRLSNLTIDGTTVTSLEDIGTTNSYRVIRGIYTPTSTNVRYASLYMLNWSGAGMSSMWIDRVYVSETTEDIYTGTVAGWTIDDTAIFTGTKDTNGFTGGGITLSAGGSIHAPKFYLAQNGDAFFKGDISGANGDFAGNLNGATITGGTIAIGSAALNPRPFEVSTSGALTSTQGTIGGWVINSTELRTANSELELDSSGKSIRFNSGSATKLEISSTDLPTLNPSKLINLSANSKYLEFLTKRDSDSNFKNSTFDPTYNSYAISTWGQFESFGRTSSNAFTLGTQQSSAHTHAGGDLTVLVPFGSTTAKVGRLTVTVPDLNNSGYYTFYDAFTSATITYRYSAFLEVQKNTSTSSQGTQIWTPQTVNYAVPTGQGGTIPLSSTSPEVILSYNDEISPYSNTSNTILKGALGPVSGVSSTYSAMIDLRSNDGDRFHQPTTFFGTVQNAGAGEYRLQAKFKVYYELRYYGNYDVSTGTASANVNNQFDLDFFQYTPSSTPVTFGGTDSEIRIGLNGIQVTGNAGTAIFGEINESGVAAIFGDALVTGRLTANTTNLSDERLKEQIKPIPSPLELIEQLNPKSFRWRNNRNPHEKRTDSYGFIAQEMTGSFPHLVSETNNPIGLIQDALTVDQMPLIALNTAGIKEVISKITSLEDKITELETALSGSSTGSTE